MKSTKMKLVFLATLIGILAITNNTMAEDGSSVEEVSPTSISSEDIETSEDSSTTSVSSDDEVEVDDSSF